MKYLEEKLSTDTYIVPIKLDSDVIVPEELSKVQWLDLNRSNALDLLKKSLDAQAERLGFDLLNGDSNLDEIHLSKKVIKESWEGLPGYEVEFSVPVFHSTNYNNIEEITKILETRFIRSLHSYRLNKIEQLPDAFSWAQYIYQRTNTYYAHYSNIFHKNNFLSIVYTISWYGAGAAHPNHHFETFNFLLTPLIEFRRIYELFKNPESCIAKIQEYTRKALLDIPLDTDEKGCGEEKMLDKEWVEKGTANLDSFSAHAFSEEGLVIYFPPYQVGAYACGSHQITVPYELFYRDLKSDIRHALYLPVYD